MQKGFSGKLNSPVRNFVVNGRVLLMHDVADIIESDDIWKIHHSCSDYIY